MGFERLKDDYPNCPDFGTIFQDLLDNPSHDHVSLLLIDGYLFKGTKLCITVLYFVTSWSGNYM